MRHAAPGKAYCTRPPRRVDRAASAEAVTAAGGLPGAGRKACPPGRRPSWTAGRSTAASVRGAPDLAVRSHAQESAPLNALRTRPSDPLHCRNARLPPPRTTRGRGDLPRAVESRFLRERKRDRGSRADLEHARSRRSFHGVQPNPIPAISDDRRPAGVCMIRRPRVAISPDLGRARSWLLALRQAAPVSRTLAILATSSHEGYKVFGAFRLEPSRRQAPPPTRQQHLAVGDARTGRRSVEERVGRRGRGRRGTRPRGRLSSHRGPARPEPSRALITQPSSSRGVPEPSPPRPLPASPPP